MTATKQPEALELASVAESADLVGYPTAKKANAYYLCLLEDCAQMIRKLQAENQSLLAERERNLASIRVNSEIVNRKNTELETLALYKSLADEYGLSIFPDIAEMTAELETLRAKLKTYEDLGDAGSDVQLLRMGYAAARLEIESLKSQSAAQRSGAAYAALSDAEIDRIVPALEPVSEDFPVEWALWKDRGRIRNELRTSHGQAPAQPVATAGGSLARIIEEKIAAMTPSEASAFMAARAELAASGNDQAAPDMRDPYGGAREDLAIWRKRALEAEALNRKFATSVNGPTFMGEPADSDGALMAREIHESQDDSLLLCASDLQHSAIYDNHVEMQSCMRAVAARIAALVHAAPKAEPAAPAAVVWPSDPSITLDFKMASKLLDMFGGEPGLVTLQHGGEKCHSGAGLYAWYSDLPEEGAVFLGAEPDDEAAPTPQQAPQQEAQEPFAWHVCSVNSDGSLSLEHAAAWEEAAHEHINDAITEHDIEGAGSWVVRPAYHAPQPSPTAQAEDSVQEDAARYRWLREGNDAKHGAAWHVAVNLYGCEWDAAIDAAMNKGATP